MKSDKKARSFVKEYNLTAPIKVSEIERIIKLQGFRIVRYGDSGTQEALRLINRLKLDEYVHLVNCFTYFDEKYKIVFIRSGLSEKDESLLLLHEEAHIYLDHFHTDDSRITETVKEQEAHRFAEYVQKYVKISSRMKNIFIPISVNVLICGIFLAACILILHSGTGRTEIIAGGVSDADTANTSEQVLSEAMPVSDMSRPDGQDADESGSDESNTASRPEGPYSSAASYSGDTSASEAPETVDADVCYWTQNGEVYHLYSDCQHIRNSSSVSSGTASESGKERVCRTCYGRWIIEEYGDDEPNQ